MRRTFSLEGGRREEIPCFLEILLGLFVGVSLSDEIDFWAFRYPDFVFDVRLEIDLKCDHSRFHVIRSCVELKYSSSV